MDFNIQRKFEVNSLTTVKDTRSLMWQMNGNPTEIQWEMRGRLDYSHGSAMIPVTDRWGFSKKIFDEIWIQSELHTIRDLEIRQLSLFPTKISRFSATLHCHGHHSKWDHNPSDFTIDIGISSVAEQAIIDMIKRIFRGDL